MNWGPYRGVRKLGEGGMGAVWEVLHAETGARYALKTLSGINPDDLERFRREASTLAGLRHPNVVAVHAGELSAPAPYFVQELCVESLADVLKRGPLSIAATQALAHDLAAGLSYLHAQGVLHRDLKPGNVLLGAGGVAKLGDFGLLRKLGEDSRRLTATGELMGTPTYMAPEQAVNSKSSGQPADVYSLGAVVYACLTGHEPFPAAGRSTLALLTAIQTMPPTPIGELRPDVPPALGQVCMACLQKDPTQRPDLAEVLACLETGSVPGGRWRGWILPTFVALTVVSGIALGWVAAQGKAQRAPQKGSPPAEQEAGPSIPRWERLLMTEGADRSPAFAELEGLLVWGELSADEEQRARVALEGEEDLCAGRLLARLAFHDGRWEDARELADRWDDKDLWGAFNLQQAEEELQATIEKAYAQRARSAAEAREEVVALTQVCFDRWPVRSPPAIQQALHEALERVACASSLLVEHGGGSKAEQVRDQELAAEFVARAQRLEGKLRDRSPALRVAVQLLEFQPLAHETKATSAPREAPDTAGVPVELAYSVRRVWVLCPLPEGAPAEALRARVECCFWILESWGRLPSYYRRLKRGVGVRRRLSHFSLQLAYRSLVRHDTQAAEAVLNRTLGVVNGPGLFVEQALCLILLGKPAQAREVLSSERSRFGWRDYLLAECELLEGRHAQARKLLAELIAKDDETRADWVNALAHAQFLLGEPAEEIEPNRKVGARGYRYLHDEAIPWRTTEVTARLLNGEDVWWPGAR